MGLKANITDTWSRLRPWARYAAMGGASLLVLAVILPFMPALHDEQPNAKSARNVPVRIGITAPPVITPAFTVAVPPPPSSSASDAALAPQIIDEADAPNAENPEQADSAEVVSQEAASAETTNIEATNVEAENKEPASPIANLLRSIANAATKLAPAPFAELTVASNAGMLPRIGPDGTAPWKAYARPQPDVPAGTPRIAVLLLDAGLSERFTPPALAALPPQISFAYSAYAPDLAAQLAEARDKGHETLLDIPGEPTAYPENNPGPDALLTRYSADQNIRKLQALLARAPGVFAITTSTGSRFNDEPAALAPILQDVQRRGLAAIDISFSPDSNVNGLASHLQLPMTRADFRLDANLSQTRMQAVLDGAIAAARGRGTALIVTEPYPLAVALLTSFAQKLPDMGIALVPVSNLISLPEAAPSIAGAKDGK